jgi:hypothetical protein
MGFLRGGVNKASGPFSKKEPKNVCLCGISRGQRHMRQQIKVFCFFFSKKKRLLPSP